MTLAAIATLLLAISQFLSAIAPLVQAPPAGMCYYGSIQTYLRCPPEVKP
jgi:hypothetical protein